MKGKRAPAGLSFRNRIIVRLFLPVLTGFVLLLFTAGPASGTVLRLNGARDIFLATVPCPDPQPSLALSVNKIYWASYTDYTAGALSLDFSVVNTGSSGAFNVQLAGATATNAVTVLTATPISIGDIPAAGAKSATFRYGIPAGVSSFRTVIYATAADSCGNSFGYPGPFPGP